MEHGEVKMLCPKCSSFSPIKGKKQVNIDEKGKNMNIANWVGRKRV